MALFSFHIERCSRVLLLAGALTVSSCGSPEPPDVPPLEVAVLEIESEDIAIYFEMIGQTRGSVDIPIRTRVDGVLEEIHFLEGREVSKNQLLYVIDPTPYQLEVVEAEGRLAEAGTRLAKASSDLDRVRPLAEMDAVSQQDLDAAVAQFDAAKAALQSARAQVEQAEIRLGYTRVESPIDGLIGITAAKVGEYVGRSPNPVVLNLVSQIDPIRVRFSINEREYLRFRRKFVTDTRGPQGQKRTGLQLLLADGSVHDHPGHIVSFDAAIDPATGTLTLEADFPNPDQIVLSGQFARIRGEMETRSNAIAVPQRAVMQVQDLFQLAVIGADDTVELRQVEVGPSVDDRWIVESGLNIGERIAVEGVQRLRPGTKVVAKEAPAPEDL